MTEQEAIDLEKKCEQRIEEELKEYYRPTEIRLSMTLTGRLNISLGSDYIILNKDLDEFEYIHYIGDWSELMGIRQCIFGAIDNYKEDYELLMWSYENRKDLTDD